MYKLLLLFVIVISSLDADLAKLVKFKYVSPHGEEIKISKDVKLIIATFEKDSGALANSYFDEQEPTYLQRHHAVFIADINKMPTIITKMFALPKLRKYKHPIFINYDEKFEEAATSKEGKITILYIEEEKIKEISYVSTQQELKEAIEK
ncbi:MAG: hypothetical protein C0627_06075 [Sulfurimonas sp.]|nr:MAG: hypothetical protein C0627_06075 [Sulfurimonas sp.]